MAMIKCSECGKEISDKALSCPNCGCPVKHKNVNKNEKMRKAFGIIDLVAALMFLVMIVTSEGGIENNSRMMGVSWLLIWCGILQIYGKHKKGVTIAAIVFYVIGIIYNLACIIFYPAHIMIATLMIIFLVLTSISLKDKESFY